MFIYEKTKCLILRLILLFNTQLLFFAICDILKFANKLENPKHIEQFYMKILTKKEKSLAKSLKSNKTKGNLKCKVKIWQYQKNPFSFKPIRRYQFCFKQFHSQFLSSSNFNFFKQSSSISVFSMRNSVHSGKLLAPRLL